MSESQEETTFQTSLRLATEAIEKIKNFDARSLVREQDLGRELSFSSAVEPAQRIINLYSQISISALEDFPENHLAQIKAHADKHYGFFQNILEFSSTQENAPSERENRLNNLVNAYDQVFTSLKDTIAYSAQRVTDFGRLEQQANAAISRIEEQTSELVEKVRVSESNAEDALKAIRVAAAESGVSQQSQFFHNAVESHQGDAKTWHRNILIVGVVLALYAVSTLFLHLIPQLATIDPWQLLTSKVLIFLVISSYLWVCIRNYTSAKHNIVVDSHRKNALLTYKALVEAAGETPNSEVILVHAAACIYGPQATGFARDPMLSGSPVQQAVELVSHPLSR